LQTDGPAGDGAQPRPRALSLAAALALLLGARGALAGAAPAPDQPDLTALPFEQLLEMEVYSASRFMQKSSQAPSAVTVIGAAEIRDFGWRTLADVMRSVRGLYVSYDRNYSYLGARSFLRPGDYNTRFLLQIDGKRINDPVYDQAPVGGEFPLDLELIERIEYVPGPGSSIYGANAFFGVINVITKRPQERDGAQGRVEAGQFGARKGSASYAGSDGQGNEWLLAASRYKSDGQDQYYAEFDTPAQNHGVARRLDYESGQRLFVKGASGPFSVSLLRAERDKGVPTASFGQAFNDPRSHTLDTQTYLDLGYRATLASGTQLSSRFYWGSYDSIGDYVNNVPGLSVDHDGSRGRWWGLDLNTVSAPLPGHKLVAGAEFQNDYRLAQFSYDIAPYVRYLDEAHDSRRFGLYLQDEVALRDALLLNAGLRYDHHERSGAALSPRLALIYQAGPATTLKALYGTAYREPNNYELYYAFPGPDGQRASPQLGRERIRSAELVLVRQLSADGRLTATAFRNVVTGLISQGSDPISGSSFFYNAGQAVAHGVETEYERHWPNQATLRASYSWQKMVQDGAGVGTVNAPASLVKLNLAAPLGRSAWRAGLEAQYVGPRDTLLAQTGGFWLANLNFNAARLTRQLSVSAGVYNLFARRYADPAPASHVQDSLVQDGRSARVTINYAF
jgi:outer membrane receptor protein involved in Fe transport